MNEFQVPTRGIHVQVFMDGGESVRGRLFAAPDRYHQGASAETVALLNDERTFLPFLVEDEAGGHFSVVLNKEHILRVRLQQDAPDDPSAARQTTGEACILHLTDGSAVEGEVMVETPPAASRLVDKLNMAPRFIPVVRDGVIDFVQRAHVRRMD